MTQVIILNSGTGSRMGALTADKPKCLVELNSTETILTRQLRFLEKMGLKEVIITTGPFEEKIVEHLKERFESLSIKYVNNPLYEETNYIYSLLLVKDIVTADVILMHGDMVFEQGVLDRLEACGLKDAVLVNPYVELPEKDFKADISEGRVKKIAVDIFGRHCVFLMPIYKLSSEFFVAWLVEMERFEKQGQLKVYAENALNNLLGELILKPVELKSEFCMEIDDQKDLELARQNIEKLGENSK